jgi:hypothetical protein
MRAIDEGLSQADPIENNLTLLSEANLIQNQSLDDATLAKYGVY